MRYKQHMIEARATFLAGMAVLFVYAPAASLAQDTNPTTNEPKAEQARGTQKRIPWTTSRITGSPEPPSPYRTEQLFPKLKCVEPLELVALTGSNRLVLAEHAGKIYSFPNDPACDKAEIFADM